MIGARQPIGVDITGQRRGVGRDTGRTDCDRRRSRRRTKQPIGTRTHHTPGRRDNLHVVGLVRRQPRHRPRHHPITVAVAAIGLLGTRTITRGRAVVEVIAGRCAVRIDRPRQHRATRRDIGRSATGRWSRDERLISTLPRTAQPIVVGHETEVIERVGLQTRQRHGIHRDIRPTGTDEEPRERGRRRAIGHRRAVLHMVGHDEIVVRVDRAMDARTPRRDLRRKRTTQIRRRRCGGKRRIRPGDRPRAVGGDDPVVIDRVWRQTGDECRPRDRAAAVTGIGLGRTRAVGLIEAVLKVIGRRHTLRIDRPVERPPRGGDRRRRIGRDRRTIEPNEAIHKRARLIRHIQRARPTDRQTPCTARIGGIEGVDHRRSAGAEVCDLQADRSRLRYIHLIRRRVSRHCRGHATTHIINRRLPPTISTVTVNTALTTIEDIDPMRTIDRKTAQAPKTRSIRRSVRPIEGVDERTRRAVKPIDHRQPAQIVSRRDIHRPIHRINRQRRRTEDRVVQRRARARSIQLIGKHTRQTEPRHPGNRRILVGRDINRTRTRRINGNRTHRVIRRPNRKPRHKPTRSTEPLHTRRTDAARARVHPCVAREDITGQRHDRKASWSIVVRIFAKLPITVAQATEPIRESVSRGRPCRAFSQQQHKHHHHNRPESSHAHSSSSTTTQTTAAPHPPTAARVST